MEIIDARIDWMDGFANNPSFKATVDSPDVGREHFTYRRQGHYLIGRHDDAPWLYRVTYDAGAKVDFLNGQDTGEFRMEDGSTCTVQNGWVSNAGDFRKKLKLDLFDLSIHVEGQPIGWAGLWITMEKLLEVLTRVQFDRPVHLNFSDQFRWWEIVKQPAEVCVDVAT